MCVAELGSAQSGTSGVAVVCDEGACAFAQLPVAHKTKVSMEPKAKDLNPGALRKVEFIMHDTLADEGNNIPEISSLLLSMKFHSLKYVFAVLRQ